MWIALGTFLGGLGLFLLAMSMITDGLKLAAGHALRGILARFTQTPVRGAASGALMTAVVQSSSAVTIATIGFVNAGLLGTAQALGVVYGATIGTTVTGWLVTLVGFQFSISAFALPLVGIGMMARLLGPARRTGAIGEALAGFGLFFIGVDLLRGAFEGVANIVDIAALSPEGVAGIAAFVGIGFLTTLVTQSSSAAIAITLTAATGGLIGLPAAAAMVIGATVGTTSTAALAVIGATPNARRVAAGNVVIHCFSACIGLLLLPVLLSVSDSLAAPAVTPALTLAVFHTTFSVAGVLLFWPFAPRLAGFLEHRFTTQEEQLGRPQHLDANVLVSPDLAIDAFKLELGRLTTMARSYARDAVSGMPQGMKHTARHDGLRALVAAIEHAVTRLERERMPQSISELLPLVLRIANYVDETVALAREQAAADPHMSALMETPLRTGIEGLRTAIVGLIDQGDPDREGFDAQALEATYQTTVQRWRELKTELLNAGVRREVPVWRLNPAIEALRGMLRIGERCTRTAIRSHELRALSRARDGAASGQPATDALESEGELSN